MKATKETKEKAKAAGIKSWHVKSEEKLMAELNGADNETKTDSVKDDVDGNINSDSGDSSSGGDTPVVCRKPDIKRGSLDSSSGGKLPTEPSRKVMLFSIGCVGKKSPYYKFKHLL